MSATVWECRICGRRIPLRVAECFCGAKREQVVAQEKREAARSPTKIPLDVALLVVLIVLVGVAGVHYALSSDAPAPEAGRNLLSGMLATPEPLPSLVTPPVAAAPVQAPATTAPPAPLAPLPEAITPPPPPLAPLPAASPSASPTPEVDEREQKKVAALAAYSAELQRLAALSARTAEHIRAYKSGCVGQNVGTQFSNCDEIEASIRKSLAEMENGLDAADDQARRSWLEPGKLRDARARTFFGTSAWEDLRRAARQVGR